MWIMTSYGILMPAAVPEDVRKTLTFPWDMQVRARDRKALAKLRKRINGSHAYVMGCSEIFATPEMDYDFRVYVQAADFADVISEDIRAIDYTKFKPTTLRKGGGGVNLHDLYNRIWFAVYDHYDRRRKNR